MNFAMNLDDLIAMARMYRLSEAEKREQIISFALGNVRLHNPSVTRAEVERAYGDLDA